MGMGKENRRTRFGDDLVHLSTMIYNDIHAYSSSSRFAFQNTKGDVPDEILSSIKKIKRVAILGAGIQGSLMSLMFRKHGYDVTLVDKSHGIMKRASAHGEGKIHMGFVYNKDLTMKTADHMMRAALRFSSYVDYLLGEKLDWDELISAPFTYLVPYSSYVSPSQFEAYCDELQKIYENFLKEYPDLSYLGHRPKNIIKRVPMLGIANSTFFEAAYKSEECSVNPWKLADIIRKALVDNSVKLVFNRVVNAVWRNEPGNNTLGDYRVSSDAGEHDFDMVVNCLWEGRRSIDKTMGINFESGNNYRFKFSVKFPFMEELSNFPAFTLVNGPFGDFVQYSRDSRMYFSYYPVALEGMALNETEMKRWEGFASGDIPKAVYDYQVTEQTKGFNMFFPDILNESGFESPTLGGGYILGNGETAISDPNDPNSKLHERSDYPFSIDDGYISVSTQKLTSAPLNAFMLEEIIFKEKKVDIQSPRERRPVECERIL